VNDVVTELFLQIVSLYFQGFSTNTLHFLVISLLEKRALDFEYSGYPDANLLCHVGLADIHFVC